MTEKLFTWKLFFNELATALSRYKDNQAELKQLIVDSFDKEAINYIFSNGKNQDEYIDPFTIIGIVNRSISLDKKFKICKTFKDIFNLSSDVPTDFDGIPVLNPQKSIYFWSDNPNKINDIENLWIFFEDIVNGMANEKISWDEDTINHYNKVIQQKGVKFNLSMALFWIDCGHYLPLDKNTRIYLHEKIGLSIEDKVPDANSYLDIMKTVQARMDDGSLKENDFCTLSYNAWARGNNKIDADSLHDAVLGHLEDKALRTLMQLFYQKKATTCIDLGRAYGFSKEEIWRGLVSAGKFLATALNRDIASDEGKVALFAKFTSTDEKITLLPEVNNAIHECLYDNLIDHYIKLHVSKPLSEDGWDELYKWQVVTKCIGKDIDEIINILCEPKANLLYSGAKMTFNELRKSDKHDQFVSIIKKLMDDSAPLNERIQTYSEAMSSLVAEGKNKANDERTAAALLTCSNPSKYTFYMYEFYEKLCSYLGEQPKNTGNSFEHYLQIIAPLEEYSSENENLHTIIDHQLKGLHASELLLTQDIIYSLFKMNEYVITLPIYPIKYWCVGIDIHEDGNNEMENIKANSTWYGYLGKKQEQNFKHVKIGDFIIIKSTFTKGTKHDLPTLRIKAIGTVKGEPVIDDNKKQDTHVYGFCPVDYFDFDTKDFESSKVGKLRTTIDSCDINEIIDYVIKRKSNMNDSNKYETYINLLVNNYNMVLTGAPGTGKTYLANAIADAMGAEKEMVQFHPSYDYTDFVEGLRPVKDTNGNISFERKDGIFKVFCRRAYENLLESQKSEEDRTKELSINERIDDFISTAIDEGETANLETVNGSKFIVTGSDDKCIFVHNDSNPIVKDLTLNKKDLYALLAEGKKLKNVHDIKNFFNRKYATQQDSYVFVLCNKILEMKTPHIMAVANKVERKNFVFIIDEINRGEISKIFGELFFSIDPGYRGEKGKVKTQYQSLVDDDDVFKDGFFVPENVYVIGTMNDIDRSVESMDFAMRRRFTWKEISAEQSAKNMNVTGDKLDRMISLNSAIEETEGLGKDFQIGGSIFLQEDDMQVLWDMHLESLLHEYLRGTPNEVEYFKKLKDAFDLKLVKKDEVTDEG